MVEQKKKPVVSKDKWLKENRKQVVQIIIDDIKDEGPMLQAIVDLISRDVKRRGPIWATLVRTI